MRQEVGVVGAKLVAGDATISHAGYVLGLNGPVGEAFAGQPMDASGYLQRLQIDQNYVAVSGKCLLVSKSLFLEQAVSTRRPSCSAGRMLICACACTVAAT